MTKTHLLMSVFVTNKTLGFDYGLTDKQKTLKIDQLISTLHSMSILNTDSQKFFISYDEEFKLYMHGKGVNIDANLFELKFNAPLNFASSRQAGLDTERINTFNTIQAVPFMSKRFALKRFLGLSEEEIADNERLWGEEQGKGQPTYTDAAGELRSAGLSAAGIEGDLGASADLSGPDDMEGDLGADAPEGAPMPVAGAPASGPTA